MLLLHALLRSRAAGLAGGAAFWCVGSSNPDVFIGGVALYGLGYFAEICWLAAWATAMHQKEGSPSPSPSVADDEEGASEGASFFPWEPAGSIPSSGASPRNSRSYLQRRGSQRASKSKAGFTTPRMGGPIPSGAGTSSPSPLLKGGPLAPTARPKRPLQQPNALAAGGVGMPRGTPKGPTESGASSLSLSRSASMGHCLNRLGGNHTSSGGSGNNSSITNTPTEAERNNGGRRRSTIARPKRRRRQQHEYKVTLSLVLCCMRWFGLFLLVSSPLYLILMLLPVDVVAWMQVPLSFCLIGAHVPRLVSILNRQTGD